MAGANPYGRRQDKKRFARASDAIRFAIEEFRGSFL
jgi:hypothetical protein